MRETDSPFAALFGGKTGEEEQTTPLPSQDIQARALIDAFAQLERPLDKKLGALLAIKKGLWSGYKAKDEQIFIISKVFDAPIPIQVEAGSTHFGCVLDIAVLQYEGDGAIEFAVDSHFFEPYTGDVA